ncbi:transporter substrate-binding domain-containing protein [Limosilactobacillus difficilis]|uniref:transporter substrate-binding domain-containing protein n=1 Tax=Limosilactobacillus difficilis TaxID=2991838 RepID=UPI0024BB06B3|nr:transporter substrate-binding domain-containing protein [Limosilactobacillus difficilis]
MKWFKRLAMVAGVAVLAVVLVACGKTNRTQKASLVHPGTLTVGLEGTYAPYSYRKDGKLTGFEVELARKLAKQMGYKVKFVPTKWDSLIAGVGAHKFDMVLNNVVMTPQRKKAYAFSHPYIYSKSALIMKKDNQTIKNAKDMKGQRIAAATGTVNADNVKKFGGKVVNNNDFATAISLIRQNRVQAALNSSEAFSYYQGQQHASDLKQVVLPTKQIPAQKIGVLMSKHNPGLVQKTNQALSHLRKTGELKKLSEKYFHQDITKP